jgi:hypothetical protein
MLLGQDAFSAQPFASSPFLGNATVAVSHNRLNFTVGVTGISTTAVTVVAAPDSLDLRTAQIGTFTVSGTALVATLDPNRLGLTIANASTIASGNAVINAAGLQNQLTFRSGTVTVSGTALVNPTGSPLTLTNKDVGVITWNEIIPGANMVWTPIEPY